MKEDLSGLVIFFVLVAVVLPFSIGLGISQARYKATKTPLRDMQIAMGWGALFGLIFPVVFVIADVIPYMLTGSTQGSTLISLVLISLPIFFVGYRHRSRRLDEVDLAARLRTWSTALAFAVTATALFTLLDIVYFAVLASENHGENYEFGIVVFPIFAWVFGFPASFFLFALGAFMGRKKAQKQPPSADSGTGI